MVTRQSLVGCDDTLVSSEWVGSGRPVSSEGPLRLQVLCSVPRPRVVHCSPVPDMGLLHVPYLRTTGETYPRVFFVVHDVDEHPISVLDCSRSDPCLSGKSSVVLVDPPSATTTPESVTSIPPSRPLLQLCISPPIKYSEPLTVRLFHSLVHLDLVSPHRPV